MKHGRIITAALAVCLLATITSVANADDKTFKRDRYLVLDSRIIESTRNAELTVGVAHKDENNPLFKEDKPWEPRFDNPYCSIIFDEDENIYKCWYSIFIGSGPRDDFPGEGLPPEKRAWVNWREGIRGFGLCYATSKDGIHWEKPELGLIDFNGSKKNNIVIKDWHGIAVIKDLHETDPQKRYKAILPYVKNSRVWFSADGIHWGNKHDVGSIDRGDTNQSVWWDDALGKYVLITRGWDENAPKSKDRYAHLGQRQEVRSVSSDFLKWSKPEFIIKGLDPRMQIHDMLVVPHAGVYLGMVGLFDVEASKQWCELAWSPDSIKWHRIQPGKPLIPNGPVLGDYDWGCIFASKPIVRKDEILLYYGANDGRFMGWRSGYLALARLRPDGFAGYEQIMGGSNKTGSVTTKPVSVVGDALCVSADVAPSGFVKVTLLDKDNNELAEGELIAKTVTDTAVQWKNGFSLEELEGKEIKLKFELRESKLFSFSFSAAQNAPSSSTNLLSRIKEPVILKGDSTVAYRDPTAVWHDGTLFLYFTLVQWEPDGTYYHRLGMSKSSDLITWTTPKPLTPRDLNLNYCAPGNVIRHDGRWVMCLQSYTGGDTARVVITRSDDLETWDKPELLMVKGPDVPRERMGRLIDPYLIEDKDEPGKWWCVFDDDALNISYSYDLKKWTYLKRIPSGENACIIVKNDEYILFHSPANGLGVKKSKDMLNWRDENGLITLGQKSWPWARFRLTAGFVLDLRHEPKIGKYVMFFHGAPNRGGPSRASLALAWSDDLKTWTWPGKYSSGNQSSATMDAR